MTAREDVRKIEELMGHPEDDMGQRNGHDVLYGSELSLCIEREGFQICIKAVDSDNFCQALTYLRAFFPEKMK